MKNEKYFLSLQNQLEKTIEKDKVERNNFYSCDSALTELNDTNEKINENINNFIKMKQEKIDKKNLLSYCGILDPGKKCLCLIKCLFYSIY